MDVLSQILKTLRLRATVFLNACFYGDWAVDTSGQYRATFHMVARGNCWLHMPGDENPIALSGGDLIVFPHDANHTLSNTQEAPDVHFPRNQIPDRQGNNSGVDLICGYFDFDRHHWNPVLDTLPELMVLNEHSIVNPALVETLAGFLAHEVESGLPGNELLIDKLSEVLFIYVVRRHLQDGHAQGFIAALADHKVGRALEKIHASPGESWSVESLARTAGMSRTAFTNRFRELTKMTPMSYLTQWRMTIAHERFIETSMSVQLVANELGYESAHAFAKAFKKHFGFGPGKARRGKD